MSWRAHRSATITLDRQQSIDTDFVGIVGKLSTDPEIRTLAAYGSAELADNDR